MSSVHLMELTSLLKKRGWLLEKYHRLAVPKAHNEILQCIMQYTYGSDIKKNTIINYNVNMNTKDSFMNLKTHISSV